MSLDGLIAVAGILLAIVAIADPVQRRSILLFVPMSILSFGMLAALAIVLFLRAADAWQIAICAKWQYYLYLASFLVPTVAVAVAIGCWQRCRLNSRKAKGLIAIIDTAFKEERYQEVERILARNRSHLHLLSMSALHRCFDRRIVSVLVEARSNLHLEMLTEPKLVQTARNAYFLFADNVIRELVCSPTSPWRSAVLAEYGGRESWEYLDEDRAVVDKTLKDPNWYVRTSAHTPLLMSGLEPIRSGSLDANYNQLSVQYQSGTGISNRASCAVYLSSKMEVLAISTAVRYRCKEDLYATDLFHIFNELLNHSRYCADIWESTLSNWEYPTPYAYLLHSIYFDLQRLFYEGLVTSVHATDSRSTPSAVSPPIEIDTQIAVSWSLCLSAIARSRDSVSDRFRDHLAQEYLNSALQLRYAPQEIPGLASSVTGLQPWWELLLEPIRRQVLQKDEVHASLARAFTYLDMGKEYVQRGSAWLSSSLGIGTD